MAYKFTSAWKWKNEPRWKKSIGLSLRLLLKGLSKSSPRRTDESSSSGLWIRGEKKQKNLNVLENVASCMFDTILYYWYDSCKVIFFKRLNNLLLCYLSVSQTWTTPPPPLSSFLWGSWAFCPRVPFTKRRFMCRGPRRRNGLIPRTRVSQEKTWSDGMSPFFSLQLNVFVQCDIS